MLRTAKSYLILALLALSVTAGGASFYLWKRNVALSQELRDTKLVLNKTKSNLALVSIQLDMETRTREAAEKALTDLRSVPDDEFNAPLPDSIRRLLPQFRDSMQPR